MTAYWPYDGYLLPPTCYPIAAGVDVWVYQRADGTFASELVRETPAGTRYGGLSTGHASADAAASKVTP